MTSELLYVGTHRRAHKADPADIAFGIYVFAKAPGDVGMNFIHMTPTPQPGWIAPHPSGKFIYVVNETTDFEAAPGGGVSAFSVAPGTGALTPLNVARTPALPCHCEVDAMGQFLLVATFGGGSVHLFRIAAAGRIGAQLDSHQHTGSSVHPRRQTRPHAHAVTLDPANRFVLVPDLGADQIVVYELDRAAGRLVAQPSRNVRVAPGSGPRHITFEAGGRFAYLMNEMTATITAFAYDPAHGALRELQSVDLLPSGFAGLRSGAELAIHPAGRFLYATTRSHGSSGEPPMRGLDSLLWFEIDPQSGFLQPRGSVSSGGEIPRSFAFDRSGDHLFVGHQCSGTVVAFRIDRQTGAPSPTGDVTETPVPVCLLFGSTN